MFFGVTRAKWSSAWIPVRGEPRTSLDHVHPKGKTLWKISSVVVSGETEREEKKEELTIQTITNLLWLNSSPEFQKTHLKSGTERNRALPKSCVRETNTTFPFQKVRLEKMRPWSLANR